MKKFIAVILSIFLILLLLPIQKSYAEDNIKLINSLPYTITSIYYSDNLLLVGTENGFFVSKDRGAHFVEADKGIGDLNISGVIYAGKKIFLGTKEAGLYISNNLGKTWISQMEKLNCPTISSISIKDNIIYVTSLCTGFHFTEDFGKTWIDRNGGLPTFRTTAFVKTPMGRCFLGTDQFGLFYSDSLGQSCVWDKFFSPYTITSISYLGSTLIVGTNVGVFTGDITNDNFKKLDFIGGSPYILSALHVKDSVVVAVQGFGLFASSDGKNFYKFGGDQFTDASVMFYDSDSNNLFIGTKSGNIYKIDLSKPYIVYPSKINVGSIAKGNEYNGSIQVFNIGGGVLEGRIESPYFIAFKAQNFSGDGKVSFTINTSDLEVGNYTEAVNVYSNGGNVKIYVSFTVEKPSSIVIKLRISSHSAFINGKQVYLDAPPFIVKNAGRTLVPVRFITEAFGAEVEWNGQERKVTIKKSPTENHPPLLIEMWIGKKVVYVNLKKQTIDVAPLIIQPGRTMVPLRFIAETLGSSVSWDGVKKEISIIYTP